MYILYLLTILLVNFLTLSTLYLSNIVPLHYHTSSIILPSRSYNSHLSPTLIYFFIYSASSLHTSTTPLPYLTITLPLDMIEYARAGVHFLTLPLGQQQRRSGSARQAMSSGSVRNPQSIEVPRKLRNMEGTCVPVGSFPPASITRTRQCGTYNKFANQYCICIYLYYQLDTKTHNNHNQQQCHHNNVTSFQLLIYLFTSSDFTYIFKINRLQSQRQLCLNR